MSAQVDVRAVLESDGVHSMKRPSDRFVENAALVLGWAGFLLVALIKWAGLQ